MIKCLYVAGTLFMTNGDHAYPVSPMAAIVMEEGEVRLGGYYKGVPAYHPDQSLPEFMLACEAEAAARVEETYYATE